MTSPRDACHEVDARVGGPTKTAAIGRAGNLSRERPAPLPANAPASGKQVTATHSPRHSVADCVPARRCLATLSADRRQPTETTPEISAVSHFVSRISLP